ncbi:hypothetical protein VST7929_02903 [Vibrio stylophorae]|uniref:Tripartite tricarboxylate transporter TctB family protein n=1 Tax=Vibrio stylophorae TaxID=659351 RepID=A0ABM8ZYB5_9VIBR|nr:hypothetical protein [Vibrio stylophorae]CAH0535276.1 hypothetical protein VST7929_02903 [Vibrio stylophorae]
MVKKTPSVKSRKKTPATCAAKPAAPKASANHKTKASANANATLSSNTSTHNKDRDIPVRYPLAGMGLVVIAGVLFMLVGERVLQGLNQWQLMQARGVVGYTSIPIAMVGLVYLLSGFSLLFAVYLPRKSNDELSRSCAVLAFIFLVVETLLFSLLLLSPIGRISFG